MISEKKEEKEKTQYSIILSFESRRVSTSNIWVNIVRNYNINQDPRILAADFKEFQSKLAILNSSIDGNIIYWIWDIREEKDWQDEPVFMEAIEENLGNTNDYLLVIIDINIDRIDSQIH